MFFTFLALSCCWQAAGQQPNLGAHISQTATSSDPSSKRLSSLPKDQGGSLFNRGSYKTGTHGCGLTNQAYYVDAPNCLMVCDIGPVTASGKTECGTLTAHSKYESFAESHRFLTAMHVVATDVGVGSWALLVAGNGDQIYIKSSCEKDPSDAEDKVKILRFTKNSSYTEMDSEIRTNHDCVQSFAEVQYLLDSENNIFFVNKGPKTSSGQTEVTKWLAEHDYQDTSNITVTTMPLSHSMSADGGWNFLMDSEDNLIAVQGPSAVSGSEDCEVQVRRMAPPYQQIDIAPAPTFQCDQHISNRWVHVLDANSNVLVINEGPYTAEGFAEVYIMKRSDHYNHISLLTKRSALPCRDGPHTSNAAGP